MVGKLLAGVAPQFRFTCTAAVWSGFSFCITQALML